MQYSIVQSSSVANLEAKIKLYLESGWTPIGGVSVYKMGNNWFHQAVTRSDNKEAVTLTSDDLESRQTVTLNPPSTLRSVKGNQAMVMLSGWVTAYPCFHDGEEWRMMWDHSIIESRDIVGWLPILRYNIPKD